MTTRIKTKKYKPLVSKEEKELIRKHNAIKRREALIKNLEQQNETEKRKLKKRIKKAQKERKLKKWLKEYGG